MTARARYFLGRKDRDEFAAACGRIRAIEKKLLGRERLSELSAAGDVLSALRLLNRWGWTVGGDPPPDGRWGEMLTSSLWLSDHTLLKMDPRPVVTKLLVLKYDLLNLGAVCRARALGRPYDGPLHPRGWNVLSTLEVAVDRMDFSIYPGPLADELCDLDDLQEGGDAGNVAAALAAARHRALRKAADGEKSRFFCDWLDHAADLQNIAVACRALAFPGFRERRPPPFPGGHLGEKLSVHPETPGDLRPILGGTVYGPLFEASLDREGGLRLSAFEDGAANILTALLEPARYVSLGPEPLWAYWLARESDARNIRTILVGLEGEPGLGELPASLRRPYV